MLWISWYYGFTVRCTNRQNWETPHSKCYMFIGILLRNFLLLTKLQYKLPNIVRLIPGALVNDVMLKIRSVCYEIISFENFLRSNLILNPLLTRTPHTTRGILLYNKAFIRRSVLGIVFRILLSFSIESNYFPIHIRESVSMTDLGGTIARRYWEKYCAISAQYYEFMIFMFL